MPRSYVIKNGDQLDRIAAANGTTRAKLLELNRDITDPNKILAGKSLFLPDAPAAPAPAAPIAPPVVPPGSAAAYNPAPAARPAAPAAPDYGAAAKSAGAAGLSLGDYASLFGATPEEQKQQKDGIAKTFGYADSDAFYLDVFQKPSKTTEQYYREAYAAAGLEDLVKKINSKKASLNSALGVVNDNPWYDEAFRRGEASRLQELANGDIKNFEDAYALSHDQVKELVARHSEDIGQDDKIKSARFTYLENAAKEAALNTATARARDNLSSYVTGKNSAAKPDTITIGDSAYKWNSSTQKFDLIASNPKPVTSDLTPYQKFQATQDLQKNLQRYTQGAREIQRQFSVMDAAYKRLASGEAKDLNATTQAIISTFNKIIDPASVVRETEYARSPEGQSLIDAITGRIAALSQGGPGLTAESLGEFVDLARVFVTNAQASIEESKALAGQNANAFGLDPALLGLPGTPSGSSGGSVSLGSWADFF